MLFFLTIDSWPVCDMFVPRTLVQTSWRGQSQQEGRDLLITSQCTVGFHWYISGFAHRPPYRQHSFDYPQHCAQPGNGPKKIWNKYQYHRGL